MEADKNGTLRYTYTDAFAGCGVALDDPELIAGLDAFVSGKDIPSQKMVTDSQGNAVCEELPIGSVLREADRCGGGLCSL